MPKEGSTSLFDRHDNSPLARPSNSQPHPHSTHHPYHDLPPKMTDYDFPDAKHSFQLPHQDEPAPAPPSLAGSTSGSAKKARQATPKAAGSLARGTACSTCRKRKLVSHLVSNKGAGVHSKRGELIGLPASSLCPSPVASVRPRPLAPPGVRALTSYQPATDYSAMRRDPPALPDVHPDGQHLRLRR